MLIALALYAFTMLVIAFVFRRYRNADDYLMGGRNASSVLVAFSLFTLIGGGELVTLCALSYTFGWAGLALFLGYFAAFVVLGIAAPLMRRSLEKEACISLPDFIHAYYGSYAGRLVFAISFIAFFALLLIQFTAGGAILAPILGTSYEVCVLVTATIVLSYLLVGGFRTVLFTDLLQGGVMLCLLPLLIYVVVTAVKEPVSVNHDVASLPLGIWASLTLTGMFVGISSSDVWQRAYAAKDDGAARIGFLLGAVLLLLFGVLLVGLGITARSVSGIESPDSAFSMVTTSGLPTWAVTMTMLLVLSAIVSTADTELFLLAGLTEREWRRWQTKGRGADAAAKESLLTSRAIMILIAVASVIASMFLANLIGIYTWMLVLLMTIAPVAVGTLIRPVRVVFAVMSIVVNLATLLLLALMGYVTLDNAYIAVLPGVLIFVVGMFVGSNNRVGTN